MTRVIIKVDYLSSVLQYYDKIKIYRSDTEDGSYVEITDVNTRIDLDPSQTIYFYVDEDGSSTKWYKTKYYNSITSDESEFSNSMQGELKGEKIGYAFKNYRPPTGEWGDVLTADDIRFHFCWGIDLVANNDEKTEVDDTQLEFAVEASVEEFEKFFNIDIRKKIYKSKPSSSLTKAVIWREGVDYTDEDEPYDFDPTMWKQYGFLQLRHRPIISLESAILQSPYQTDVIDLTEWASLYKKAGQVSFYPKGSTVHGIGYAGSGILAAWPGMMARKYPQGFKIDYTTGFPNSDFVPKDLRNAIGMLSTLNVLGWIGDGLYAGVSSISTSLDGLNESFSSTQSATSIDGKTVVKDFGKIKKMYKNRKKLIGKKIISINKETKEYEEKELLDVLRHNTKNKKCFKIKTDNGKKIIITEDHSLFTSDMKAIKGLDIKIGTILSLFFEASSVKNIKRVKRKWMYDLCVKDNENFIANDFIASNSAYFGARIKSYTDQLKVFVNNNKNKYSNIPIRFI